MVGTAVDNYDTGNKGLHRNLVDLTFQQNRENLKLGDVSGFVVVVCCVVEVITRDLVFSGNFIFYYVH